MWCGNCYTSNINVKFPVKKKALDKYKDLDHPNERERLQVAWEKKIEPEDDFSFGRYGYHCIVLFKCDTCIFRKLQDQSPNVTDPADELLLACIR
jgi:hypothetical protein